MREGYLSSINGVVDLPPEGVIKGAHRTARMSPSTGGAEESFMMSPPDMEVPEKKP